MASTLVLLQLDDFPGPFRSGQYRGAFKLETFSLDSRDFNSRRQHVGTVSKMEISIVMRIDEFASQFRLACDQGKIFKRAVLVLLSDAAHGTLI